MEENNIDKYFKERLHEHAEVPSAGVWERIDAQLAGGKDVKAAGLHWRSVALLSLALLLLVSGLFYWRMDRLDRENSALERELTEQRVTPIDPIDVAAAEKAPAIESAAATREKTVRVGLRNEEVILVKFVYIAINYFPLSNFTIASPMASPMFI